MKHAYCTLYKLWKLHNITLQSLLCRAENNLFGSLGGVCGNAGKQVCRHETNLRCPLGDKSGKMNGKNVCFCNKVVRHLEIDCLLTQEHCV